MKRDRGALEEALEEVLKLEANKWGNSLVMAIRPIIVTNLRSGRVSYFLDKVVEREPAEYVGRVAGFYKQLSPYLHQVQVEKSEEVWRPLFERLQRWVYNFLVSNNFAADCHTHNRAIEYATEAAATLLTAYFPYDVGFEAWAYILTRNVTCKLLKQSKRTSRTGDETLPLEEELHYFRRLRSEPDRRVWELRRDLLDAVAGLSSETRKQIILRYYFDNFSFAEIAQELDQPINTIYQEHFRSRKELRKILGQNGYKDV
jgi:RNA polymerase sigma factor (sigma-70 family)